MRRRYNGHLSFFYLLLKWDGKLQLLRVFEETNWGTFLFFVTLTKYALLLRTKCRLCNCKMYIYYNFRKSRNNM